MNKTLSEEIDPIMEATKVFGEFLPDDYNVPTESRYMKFEKGENKFRILQKPILGWEYWTEDSDGNRKPLRKKMDEPFTAEVAEDPTQIKHFWAMCVWNYKTKSIQILEITQKGIIRTIRSLSKDPEWGNPMGYDLSVVREGEGMKTEYQTIPSPPKELSQEIKTAWEAVKDTIHIEALYKGDDPFKNVI